MSTLARVLLHNRTLSELNLCGNMIDDEGVVELAACMLQSEEIAAEAILSPITSPIKSPIMSPNSGSKAEGAAVEPQGLQILNLCCNKLGTRYSEEFVTYHASEDGSQAIGRLLREHAGLTSLDVSRNVIDVKCASHIEDALNGTAEMSRPPLTLHCLENPCGVDALNKIDSLVKYRNEYMQRLEEEERKAAEEAKLKAEAEAEKARLAALGQQPNSIASPPKTLKVRRRR